MLARILIITFLLPVAVITTAQHNTINVSGQWYVSLDAQNECLKKNPEEFLTRGNITLPGSLAENGFGYKTKGSDYGILTPEFKYIGKAWYKRQIEIPQNWEGKEIELILERVLWQSTVFLNGIELSKQDALGTPHIHKLGKVKPGEHELSILVNNEMIHNIGDKGHAYGEYTQSIWNGIIGRMEIRAKDETHFVSCQVYSDIQNETITLKTNIQSKAQESVHIKYEIVSLKSGDNVLSGEFEKEIKGGETKLDLMLATREKLEKWNEFNPKLYILKLFLISADSKDYFETEFGFYQLSHDGTKFHVNGTPVFLRGNLDCVHFPLTAYVSCDLHDWIIIFETYKKYGLNHARFHSWCPPEAAFRAANRVGIYLQAEASIWIDWWMSTDMIKQGRPEMDTKGHPKGLGYDTERDKFVIAEMSRVVETYGNHPSFTLFCIGNELGNSDFNVMKEWVRDLKEKDPRRMYSVSTAREITEVDDFMATHYIKDVGRTRGLNGARTDWNFEEVYAQMGIPIIAHEIGQWPVYPRWSEIDKYTGVLKARNLEEFRQQAEKNGIANLSDKFADASGALNQIMYKYEIESFLRTPGCAGIQLLSMQDYQGQGEALIGWLDCHWESKNITSPEKFRQHFAQTVPLLQFEKYVWENDEVFKAKAQVSHHAERDLKAELLWDIVDNSGKSLGSGKFAETHFKNGTLTDVGEISFKLESITEAKKLTISVAVLNSTYANEWNVWVYPKQQATSNANDIIVTDRLNDDTFDKLKSGAKVLLQAHELGTEKTSVKALFYPLYWSLTFFPGQGKTNIGLLLNENHPAFANFPTSFHSDWQWESISGDAKGFLLNDLPHEYLPIAQPIDDFHRNNKVGSVFEFSVGKGKLMVCGYNLKSEKPVARQLKMSLLEYMNSRHFNPAQTIDEIWLTQTFKRIPKAEKAEVPEAFNNAVLIVNAAENLQQSGENIPWDSGLDKVERSENIVYKVNADGTWKEKDNSAWHGKEMSLHIDCPEGMLGTLLVHFSDWNKNGRSGVLEFEGRKSKLDLHPVDGIWVKFHVMREDSNDGELLLKTKAETGPNLMISKVILLKE